METDRSAASAGSQQQALDVPNTRRSGNFKAVLRATLYGVAARFKPAVLTWLPRYRWHEQLKSDVVAGVTLAVMGLPQGLAYASLVGIDPVHGIFTVIFPPIIYSLIGQSRQGAVGPMSIPCLVIAAIVDEYHIENTDENGDTATSGGPDNPTRLELTMALTMTIGMVMVTAGLLRVGVLIDFISDPNLKGFVQASALMVIVSMTPKVRARQSQKL